MSIHTSPLAVGLAVLAVGFGVAVSHVAYRAFRRTGTRSLGHLALGFGALTLAIAANAAFGLVGNAPTAALLQGLLAAFGFGVICYALYAREDDDGTDADADAESDTESLLTP